MDGFKMKFLSGRPIFRAYVSFREGKHQILANLNPQLPDPTCPTLRLCRVSREKTHPVGFFIAGKRHFQLKLHDD